MRFECKRFYLDVKTQTNCSLFFNNFEDADEEISYTNSKICKEDLCLKFICIVQGVEVSQTFVSKNLFQNKTSQSLAEIPKNYRA